MKNKTNRSGDIYVPKKYDSCQTPPHAIEPLLEIIPKNWVIWECAAGEGNLVKEFMRHKYACIGTDILTGSDFFTWEPESDYWTGEMKKVHYDVIVTNPPFSIKYKWLKRCYELGKPFALLMPVEMLGAQTAQKLFVEYGIELLFLPRRVNFKMPYKGYDGKGAQFPVMWYTWKLLKSPVKFWGWEDGVDRWKG